MVPPGRTGCIAVDLGKTRVRIRGYGTASPLEANGAGAPGLADDDDGAAFRSIAAAIAAWPASAATDAAIWSLGVAGADSAPRTAVATARRLRAEFGTPVVLASDVVTAHIGALGGATGTLLLAGTGAVALRIDSDGAVDRSDGWGPWLGDEGGGRWIGQRGLQAVLRASDGRGPRTMLTSDARELFDVPLKELPRVIGGRDAAAQLGAFAPRVLARAGDGDHVAMMVIRDATHALACAAAAVSPEDGRIFVVGGLSGDNLFRFEIRAALRKRGLTLHQPLGDALDGAASLATRTDLPHERLVIRV